MDNTKGIGRADHNTPSLKKGKKHILGIGINDYTHWSKLRNATNDLDDVVKILMERYDFDTHHLTLLKEEDATRKNIVNKLHHFTNPTVLGEDDSLLIYFSGHGFLDENEEGYWVPVDSEKDDIDSFIPNLTIQSKIKNMKCRHVLLISDSCFSGSLMAKGERLASVETLVAGELEVKKSRWIITSGGRDETVSDGSGKNSPFAEAIISELKHNTKAQFIVDELAMRVRNITRGNATQMPQVEKMFQSGDLGGRFIFYLKTTINPEVAEWEAAKAENTEGAYARYLRKYKHGQFIEEAEMALEILEKTKEQAEEDALWQEVKDKNSTLGYIRYLRKYKNGRYAQEADDRLDAIENQEHIEKQKREKAEQARKAQLIQQEAERKEREKQEAEKRRKVEEENAQKEKERLARLDIERKKQEEASRKQREAAEQERLRKELLAKLEPEMILVKGGSFNRGSQKVTLSDFSIGKFPITVKQYLAFIQETKQNLPEWLEEKSQYNIKTGSNELYKKLGDALQNDNNPIVGISWHDANAYCQWLSKKTSQKYQLPTEAQWEFAARGGIQSKDFKYSGSNDIDKVAWYHKYSSNITHPVGEKDPNELGIYDMSGNVWEWCSDYYSEYGSSPVTNPTGAVQGSDRVFRGGSWLHRPQYCLVVSRNYDLPTLRRYYLGFRVLLSL